jgi:hypothetical protein
MPQPLPLPLSRPPDESHPVVRIPATNSARINIAIPGRAPALPLEVRPLPRNVYALKVAVKQMFPDALKQYDPIDLVVYQSPPNEPPLPSQAKLEDGLYYWIVVRPYRCAPALHLTTPPVTTAAIGLTDPTALHECERAINANVNGAQGTNNNQVIDPAGTRDGNCANVRSRPVQLLSKASSSVFSLPHMWSSTFSTRHHKQA